MLPDVTFVLCEGVGCGRRLQVIVVVVVMVVMVVVVVVVVVMG